MNQPLIVIYCTVILDAMGIGIIFPILPALLKDITHTDNVALYLGILTALYAVIQFIFAPVQRSERQLSDAHFFLVVTNFVI